MTTGERTRQLLIYIESKNSHGRIALANEIKKLGLERSDLYTFLTTAAPTSMGKNQVKDKMLQLIVTKLK